MVKFVLRKVYELFMAIVVDVCVIYATLTGYLYCELSRYTFEYLCEEYNLTVELYPTLESFFTQYEWYGTIQNVCLLLLILAAVHCVYEVFKVLMDS